MILIQPIIYTHLNPLEEGNKIVEKTQYQSIYYAISNRFFKFHAFK